MDEAHKEIADKSSVLGAVEKGVFAVEDRPFQDLLAQIVVERCPGDAQKLSESAPALEHVADGFAKPRVRLHLLLIKLIDRPAFELFH